jgi:hypothetical protein
VALITATGGLATPELAVLHAGIIGAETLESGAVAAERLTQDVGVSPTPLRALPLNRPVGGSATQNAYVQDRIAALRDQGAFNFRVNQQQVDINGARVGINRADLQYTSNNQRCYEEFDVPSSTRGPGHKTRILSNDPNGNVELFEVK